jgi:hypothetical protein
VPEFSLELVGALLDDPLEWVGDRLPLAVGETDDRREVDGCAP